jgi:hypothetical protein
VLLYDPGTFSPPTDLLIPFIERCLRLGETVGTFPFSAL